MTLESRYRRLLRWYPAGWLARDHDVLLGTLLDAAEAAERHRPRAAEVVSIALHGLAERATRRVAVVSSSIATGLSAIAAVLFFAAVGGGGWGLTIPLLLVVAPPLLLLSGAALLHGAGLIGARTTVALPAVGVAAGLAGAATAWGWVSGFDEADEGRAVPAVVNSIALAAFGTAWLLVAGVIVTVMLAVLRPAGESLALRLIPAIVVGVVGAPALGVAFLQPGGAFVCSGAVLAAALLVGQHRVERLLSPPAPARVRSRRRADPAAFSLATVGTAASAAAVVFCFAGGPLELFGLDGTEAMGAGLSIGALAGLPVLVAAVRSTDPRPPRAAALLAAAGLVVNAAARLPGPFPADDGSFGVLIGSGALLAAAIARITYPRMPGPPWTRIVLAGLAGALLLAGGGIMLTAALGFLVPIAGVVVMVRSRRQASRTTVAVA